LTAARDHSLAGAILISAADMGAMGQAPRERVVATMADDLESLAGVTPESMTDEVRANSSTWTFDRATEGLAHVPLLVLTSDDGLAPAALALVKAVQANGNTRVTTHHEATDHSWSGKRIALESAVVNWLQQLR
jgi:hypothetical protein